MQPGIRGVLNPYFQESPGELERTPTPPRGKRSDLCPHPTPNARAVISTREFPALGWSSAGRSRPKELFFLVLRLFLFFLPPFPSRLRFVTAAAGCVAQLGETEAREGFG